MALNDDNTGQHNQEIVLHPGVNLLFCRFFDAENDTHLFGSVNLPKPPTMQSNPPESPFWVLFESLPPGGVGGSGGQIEICNLKP